MHKFDRYLFLATSAPIGLFIGHASVAAPHVLTRSVLDLSQEAWHAYVLDHESEPASWLAYEQSCTASGGRWDHELHCCHAARPASPQRSVDDEGDEPIATK